MLETKTPNPIRDEADAIAERTLDHPVDCACSINAKKRRQSDELLGSGFFEPPVQTPVLPAAMEDAR